MVWCGSNVQLQSQRAKSMGSNLMVIFRALSLQLGIGSETTRSLMENLLTSLALEIRQQTRYFFFSFLAFCFSMLDSFGMLSVLVIFYTRFVRSLLRSSWSFPLLIIAFYYSWVSLFLMSFNAVSCQSWFLFDLCISLT